MPAIDLYPAGDSWSDLVTPPLKRRIPIPVAGVKRPWPNNAHLPFQYVYKFRQLIQATCPQKPPKSCQTLSIRKQIFLCVKHISHSAKLIYPESFSVPTDTFLTIQDWNS